MLLSFVKTAFSANWRTRRNQRSLRMELASVKKKKYSKLLKGAVNKTNV